MTEAPQILLRHHLKQLRLPTFQGEYAKQAQLCAAENKDEAVKALAFANKKLDKSLSKGINHKNYVARQKSRLSKLVNSL